MINPNESCSSEIGPENLYFPYCTLEHPYCATGSVEPESLSCNETGALWSIRKFQLGGGGME
jgi:hypothetical protein